MPCVAIYTLWDNINITFGNYNNKLKIQIKKFEVLHQINMSKNTNMYITRWIYDQIHVTSLFFTYFNNILWCERVVTYCNNIFQYKIKFSYYNNTFRCNKVILATILIDIINLSYYYKKKTKTKNNSQMQ